MATHVLSLMDLGNRALANPYYERILRLTAENLGGPMVTDTHRAYQYLETCAIETSEEGVVGEANLMIDLCGEAN